jgi:hypothetical protein
VKKIGTPQFASYVANFTKVKKKIIIIMG